MFFSLYFLIIRYLSISIVGEIGSKRNYYKISFTPFPQKIKTVLISIGNINIVIYKLASYKLVIYNISYSYIINYQIF